MLDGAIHPNTKAMIEAWKNMGNRKEDRLSGPRINDFPEVIGSLFVIQHTNGGIWPFRIAGNDLSRTLGRELNDQDFLGLWRGRDLSLVAAQLDAVRFSAAPGLIRGSGEILTGEQIEVEIALAPLDAHPERGDRILGLYQTIGGNGMHTNRPIWRHHINAIFPPEATRSTGHLRLVANNA